MKSFSTIIILDPDKIFLHLHCSTLFRHDQIGCQFLTDFDKLLSLLWCPAYRGDVLIGYEIRSQGHVQSEGSALDSRVSVGYDKHQQCLDCKRTPDALWDCISCINLFDSKEVMHPLMGGFVLIEIYVIADLLIVFIDNT